MPYESTDRQAMLTRTTFERSNSTELELKRQSDIIGVPLAYGASMAGVDLGPAALRVASSIGESLSLVTGARSGDLEVEQSQTTPEPADKLKYLT